MFSSEDLILPFQRSGTKCQVPLCKLCPQKKSLKAAEILNVKVFFRLKVIPNLFLWHKHAFFQIQ